MEKKHIWMVIIAVVILTAVVFVGSTYVNGQSVLSSPSATWVSHTEYWSGDNGSTIVRLSDYQGNPFLMDNCSVTILYPDKTIFVRDQAMSESTIPGNWYAITVLPSIMGTYEQEVTCYANNKATVTSNSFHLNPALEQIKSVDANTIALQSQLSNVNLSIDGTLNNVKTDVLSTVTLSQSNLTDLMNTIRTDLETKISDTNGNLSGQLSNVETNIVVNIADINKTIVSKLNLTESNLNSVMDRVEADITSQLNAVNASTDARLTDVQTSLTATVDTAKQDIIYSIQNTNATLSTLMNTVNTQLQNQMTTLGLDINTNIDNADVSLTGTVDAAREQITLQNSAINTSISQLVTSTTNDIQSYMQTYLPQLLNASNNIYSDTQWLVTNAMNKDDRAAVDARFTSLDNNMALLKDFCNNPETNSSALCAELYHTDALIETLRVEQNNYYTNLSTVTTNTWDLLSGNIASNIDNILVQLSIIKGQTTDINTTIHDIRDDQLNEVRANILS